MSLTKLVCPECSKVLKPASPVAPGKKVRCPKCQVIFVAAAGDDEEEGGAEQEDGADRPKKKKKKAAAKPEAAAKKSASAEDEEGAYSLVRDEEDQDNPKISYAPDTSIKDLRGPAVAALMGPTNWLIRSGFIGVFGCIALILLLAIPALLPVHEDDNPEARQALPMMKVNKGFGSGNPTVQQGGGPGGVVPPGGQQQQPADGEKKDQLPKNKLEEPPSVTYVCYFFDFGSLCDLNPLLFLLSLIPFILLGCYSAAICVGGIKAQNLESRGWGMTASIMAMLPLNTVCANIALAIVFKFFVYLVLDYSDDLAIFLVGTWLIISHVIFPLSCGSGIWTLITLNKPEVLEGFQYEGE